MIARHLFRTNKVARRVLNSESLGEQSCRAITQAASMNPSAPGPILTFL
eukprot:CAMPEP_0196148702 /NCGR_PEP_ID=MMETSP0910-20130528/28240_1 /TAXON_ID=49265 /ORGANISM="Thalassiosira rotula, Strain GSO102" /LENGTH=48 /DNA_ID= /DNA_START= /DNA_END= /DNA_ORIENTATION=